MTEPTTSNDVSRMVETLQLSARTAVDGGVVIEPVILTEAAALLAGVQAQLCASPTTSGDVGKLCEDLEKCAMDICGSPLEEAQPVALLMSQAAILLTQMEARERTLLAEIDALRNRPYGKPCSSADPGK